MLEPLPLLLATPIAKAILDKFYEGLGTELAKKAGELPATLIAKVQQLGQVVWEKCLRGKPDTDKLLQAAADNSQPESAAAQTKLTEYLYKVLESDTSLKQDVKKLADELHFELTQIEDNSSQTQINYGGNNSQNRISGGTVYQGDIKIYQGLPPD
ncbi:MAG: hypothetical protein HC879_20020 [Leptolyngbyaceae cyanobacterium SL_5_9]|nr:hypothetical protein [Leptolyngbyaceae cyanobacterium SL_5_9]NJO76588.1 hypothetical protein [Leptolyngbyaceae cyanobacterium RM1_406_9]